MTDQKESCAVTQKTGQQGQGCCAVSGCCGVNVARFVLAGIGVFAFFYLYDTVLRQLILQPFYEETAGLWRAAEDRQMLFPWVVAHHFLLAFVVLFLFTRHYEARGWMEGLRFGLLTGTIFALLQTASFAWMPVPVDMILAAAGVELMKMVLAGILMALIYRRAG